MYQKLTAKIAGTPEERILSFLMLRSLKQARYSELNEGHFALAAPTYTHFTSPIRRYPDLIVHRILRDALRESSSGHHHHKPAAHAPGLHVNDAVSPWSKRLEKDSKKKRPPQRGPLSLEELHDIADTSSKSERAADDAERELLEWKKLKFMQDRVGEDFQGLIVSVTKFGFFVELEELFIEGLVPLNSLVDDHYTFRENTRQIIGSGTKKTFSIGDKVRVLVDRIDRMQRKIQFAVLEEQPSRAQKRHRKRG